MWNTFFCFTFFYFFLKKFSNNLVISGKSGNFAPAKDNSGA